MKTAAAYDTYNAIRVIRSDSFTKPKGAIFVRLIVILSRAYRPAFFVAILDVVGIPDNFVRIGMHSCSAILKNSCAVNEQLPGGFDEIETARFC